MGEKYPDFEWCVVAHMLFLKRRWKANRIDPDGVALLVEGDGPWIIISDYGCNQFLMFEGEALRFPHLP